MHEPFDPYYKWLSIPPDEQPPDCYRLLGVRRFEADADVIEAAADRQMAYLKMYQIGPHMPASQKLLGEVAAARICLLNPDKRAAYDAKLKAELPAAQAPAAGPAGAEGEPDGSAFGEYLLVDLLGRGGTGPVFKARHRTLGRTVALKILSQQATGSAELVARFHRKVKILARFEHPNLVGVHDAGCREGIHYLVMEYVDGEDLGALAKRFHPLPIEYAASYITQAAAALGYAHSRGVYHRNVKPSNILVNQQGVVKVIGLGLARIDLASDISLDADLTGIGAALGTLDYMAPEQIGDAKSVDQRADVYSLGCTFYAVLANRLPYPVKGPMNKVLAHRTAPVPSLPQARPDASVSLDRVLQTMMAKQPAERYQTMDDLIAALGAIKHDLVQSAPVGQPAAPNPELDQFLTWMAEREGRRAGR